MQMLVSQSVRQTKVFLERPIFFERPIFGQLKRVLSDLGTDMLRFEIFKGGKEQDRTS